MARSRSPRRQSVAYSPTDGYVKNFDLLPYAQRRAARAHALRLLREERSAMRKENENRLASIYKKVRDVERMAKTAHQPPSEFRDEMLARLQAIREQLERVA